MKKFLFGTAGLLLIAASCSKNEVVEVNRDGDEISFNVVAGNATKAADIYCNNNKPSGFTVYAESDDKTYINGDRIVSTDGGNTWVNESGTRFWPNESKVDFYAVENGTITWNPDAAEGTAPASIANFEVSTAVASQKDLLYSVKMDQTKGETAETTSPVTLNFRHALSQIVFNAKNTNANLYVEISGVSVVNVGNKNTFAFPTDDTDNNMVDADHDGSFDHTIDYTDGSWGKWNALTSGSTVYPVDFETVKVEGTNTVVDLTANVTGDNAVKNEFNKNALLLLPQTTTAWDPETVPYPGTVGKAENGSYFLVNCAIWNVAGDSINKDTDVLLWGGENGAPKQAAIPAAFTWEQGKKYIYTFIFGEGGGYDPDPEDPDPDPEDPDPVLIPITFEVTVDDFVEVKPSIDVPMEVEVTESTEDAGQGE